MISLLWTLLPQTMNVFIIMMVLAAVALSIVNAASTFHETALLQNLVNALMEKDPLCCCAGHIC